jgi:hypothetical protein
MQPAIEVLYSCEVCGLKDAKLNVAARAEHQHVAAWMEATVFRIARDHSRLSPNCTSITLTEIKVPIEAETPIGGPVKPREAC